LLRDKKLKFIARCDKFQSYERHCRVMIALQQVLIFRKRKSYEFRLRRNAMEPAVGIIYMIKTRQRFPKCFAQQNTSFSR
jgi:hypothetical protein